MIIHDVRTEDLERLKELKVRMPQRMHLRLLSMKLLQGTTMSSAVQEALDDYFEKLAIGRRP